MRKLKSEILTERKMVMATCGSNESGERTSTGDGYGITVNDAKRAARAHADFLANAEGLMWIDSLNCPRGCPLRVGGQVILGDIVVTTLGPPLGKGTIRLHRYQAVRKWTAKVSCNRLQDVGGPVRNS